MRDGLGDVQRVVDAFERRALPYLRTGPRTRPLLTPPHHASYTSAAEIDRAAATPDHGHCDQQARARMHARRAEGERALVVHGPHRPVLVAYDNGRVFALDNRCPHMGFPLDRGRIEDGILTCHRRHARFDLTSGCTFDLWADDVPTCPVEVRGGEVWIEPTFSEADPAAHWRNRLQDGLALNLGLVVAKALYGQLSAGVPPIDIVRQAALFGCDNRDGWSTGLTILTALGNILPVLDEREVYLALFHGVRRVAADCDGEAPRRKRAPLTSDPELPLLKQWLQNWTAVRHRDGAERSVLTAIAAGASAGALAELMLAAASERVFADDGHVLHDVSDGG